MSNSEQGGNRISYSFAHLGINSSDETTAAWLAQQFSEAFHFPSRDLTSSFYVGSNIELMKQTGRGMHGHIAVQTNNIELAIEDLKQKHFMIDKETVVYKDGKLKSVYLGQDFGGFAVHLLER